MSSGETSPEDKRVLFWLGDRLIVHFDNAGLFMQLGILPKQGSRQESVMQAVHRLRMRVPGLR